MEFLPQVLLALLAATAVILKAFLTGTAVLSTELYSYRPPSLTYDCNQHYCSWEKGQGSSEPQSLRLNSTEFLTVAEDWPLACKPHKFGYSIEDATRLFSSKTYSTCDENRDGSFITFDPFKDEFELICPDNLVDSDWKGAYVLGDSVYLERQGRYPFEKDLIPYKGKVKIDREVEFVYATCHKNPSTVEHAAYHMKPKPEVRARVEEQMKQQQLLLGDRQEVHPLTVIHIVLDSLSRSHFYRNFPETIAFLNSKVPSSKYQMFDFKINNVMGNNSPPNVLPFLTGKIGFTERRDAKEDFLGPNSLYARMRDMVFHS